MRAVEFDAIAEGDWAFHCHKSHHTMNAMGHNVPTMIGVDQKDVVQKIRGLMPDYMAMGEDGMAEMGSDGNAVARQHAADDDRPGTLWRDGDGRHVHDREGPQGNLLATITRTRAGTSNRRAARRPSGQAHCPLPRAPPHPSPTATRSTCASPPATSIEEIAMRPVALAAAMLLALPVAAHAHGETSHGKDLLSTLPRPSNSRSAARAIPRRRNAQ
jgi:hypothetical protein